MTEALHILLVDDSEADNFIHRLEIESTGVATDIQAYQYADEALHYLKTPVRKRVDLILLDINMPRMDGFEFIEAYSALYDELKDKTVVLMLTTSLNPEDRERASRYPDILDFLEKPLDREKAQRVFDKYF